MLSTGYILGNCLMACWRHQRRPLSFNPSQPLPGGENLLPRPFINDSIHSIEHHHNYIGRDALQIIPRFFAADGALTVAVEIELCIFSIPPVLWSRLPEALYDVPQSRFFVDFPRINLPLLGRLHALFQAAIQDVLPREHGLAPRTNKPTRVGRDVLVCYKRFAPPLQRLNQTRTENRLNSIGDFHVDIEI